MTIKTKQKTWHYTYTFSISFVGQMSKIQFIADVSSLTRDSKNFIRTRVSETYNAQNIAAAKAKPGQVIKVVG